VAGQERPERQLGYSRQRFLSPFRDRITLTGAPLKDLITVDHSFVDAGYLVTPRWRVRGALDWYNTIMASRRCSARTIAPHPLSAEQTT